jgi:hypothetical protein
MTIVDCAEFESALADLLAEPGGAADDRRERLRRHATSCDRCRGALGLVDLAAAPAESRDPIPDPGPGYWRGFEERLAERIAGPTRRSSRLRLAFWGAGAIAVAACCALALLVPRRAPSGAVTAAARPPQVVAPSPAQPPHPAPAPALAKAPAEAAGARSGVRSATPPPPLPVDVEAVEEDDLADASVLGAPPDPFAEADEAALFPSVDDLSDDEKKRFADWLALEEERVRRGAV